MNKQEIERATFLIEELEDTPELIGYTLRLASGIDFYHNDTSMSNATVVLDIILPQAFDPSHWEEIE